MKDKLKQLSNRPGVYLMKDRLGRVIYVGKAKSLAKRVRSYFQAGRQGQMDPKTRSLVSVIADLETHEVRNEAEAILLEGRLIKQYRPKYNILFRDDKRFMLVRLTRELFPRFVLTRLQKPDGCRYFGPFSSSSALRQTLEYIKHYFHIRSCPLVEPGPEDYRHCHNDLLQHCSAPCVQRVSPEEYARWIDRACQFLEGKDEISLTELEQQMLSASEKKDYEKAAILRDVLYDLRQTVKQSARKFARDMPLASSSEEDLRCLMEALKLQNIPHIIEGFDISHIFGQHTVGSMVHFEEGRPLKKEYRHFNIQGKTSTSTPVPRNSLSYYNDDYASIREIVGRRYQRMKREQKKLPDLVLIDGGRGQLNSAISALREVEVKLNIIGLAKENEEIYLPHQEEPLRLPSHSPALRLLQRIRDESHRFANLRHDNWRRKQIRNSILDEFPGIGEKRKQVLLKHFGSVEKIRKASAEEIAKIDSIGYNMAVKLLEYLQGPRHGFFSI